MRSFNVAVHEELRDLHSRCTGGGRALLGARRGINASGAARVAAMIGTPLRVTRLTKELAQSYVRWPPCLAASCWLSAVEPQAPACKEYLVKGLSAKLLFLYGAAQTLRSPDAALLAANSGCFALTLGAFVVTNFDKRLYERWHPWGLHVVPGVWSTLVALHNAPLLPAALVPSGPLLSVPGISA